MSQPQIAMILYTVREPAKADLPDTLRRVREAGFRHVQWSGMPPLPADEIRAALDAAGLTAIAAHCGMEPFEKDFEAQVAFWNTVGAKDVAPGGMMRDCTEDREAWLRGAARLDAIGAKLREVGMRLSYHNHAHELESFPGDTMTKLDLLYSSTSAENLYAELDLAWLYAGGADPAAMIRKYANRCPVLHIKDMKAERNAGGGPVFTPLGKGALDWDGIFDAVRESGVEWCVYEQDSCEGDIFDAVRESYAFLSQHF
jgi:sugar phosphate isomerase/epimerase